MKVDYQTYEERKRVKALAHAEMEARQAGWRFQAQVHPFTSELIVEVAAPRAGTARAGLSLRDLLKFFPDPLATVEGLREERLAPLPEMEDVVPLEMATIPEDCTGLSVLDIGGYDGHAAAEALRRGARSAVVWDNQQYKHYGWSEPKPLPGVEYVAVDFQEAVDDRWEWPVPQFDLAICTNVIYHCDDPVRAVRALRRLTRGTLALVTMTSWEAGAQWRICEPLEVNPADETVYWVPTRRGLAILLKREGFTEVQEIGRHMERLGVRAS